jgi:type VI protein secretion system component VasF
MIALIASLVFAWPVLRTSFRLRTAERTETPAPKQPANDVLSRVWSKTAAALRAPLWSRVDHWMTLIAFVLVVLATVFTALSRWM